MEKFARNFLISVVGSACVLGAAAPSDAKPFSMHTVLRNFCCTDWTDRTATPTPAPNPGGGAFLLIGGEVAQAATVGRTIEQTTIAPPYAIAFPADRVGTHYSVFGLPNPNPIIDELSFTVDLWNEAAVLAAGAGPGSFQFCPQFYGPGPGSCPSILGQVTSHGGTTPFHGRIEVTAGVNQFGGTMRMLGSGLRGVIQMRNAAGSSASVFTVREIALPLQIIGGGTTAMGLLAYSLSSPVNAYYATSMHSGPALLTDTDNGRATGIPWTTGMVTISITALNVPPFQAVTLTGSDQRITTGPDRGKGNLTLVSGNLYQKLDGSVSQVRGTTLSVNLPEPAMGTLVAVGALGLVSVGVSRRRADHD